MSRLEQEGQQGDIDGVPLRALPLEGELQVKEVIFLVMVFLLLETSCIKYHTCSVIRIRYVSSVGNGK